MRPDFIISEKHTAEGSVYIVLPTHISALNWLFARVTAAERRQMSAHLVGDRFAQFKQEAAASDMSFHHSFSAAAEPEQIQ
jgi:hypothetical protein